jgi:hypothetical protein
MPESRDQFIPWSFRDSYLFTVVSMATNHRFVPVSKYISSRLAGNMYKFMNGNWTNDTRVNIVACTIPYKGSEDNKSTA